MTDRIDLTGISVRAHHGVLPVEKQRGQAFVVDVSAFTDFAAAAASDDLDDAIDYDDLAQRIHDLVAAEKHNLIEKVAARVAESVLADSRVSRVIVTVHKPDAPLSVPFSDVAVTVDRSR